MIKNFFNGVMVILKVWVVVVYFILIQEVVFPHLEKTGAVQFFWPSLLFFGILGVFMPFPGNTQEGESNDKTSVD